MSGVPRALLRVLIEPRRLEELTLELGPSASDQVLMTALEIPPEVLAERLEQGMARFPEIERRAIVLLYYEARTHLEVSERLGVTIARIERAETMGILRLRGSLRPAAE